VEQFLQGTASILPSRGAMPITSLAFGTAGGHDTQGMQRLVNEDGHLASDLEGDTLASELPSSSDAEVHGRRLRALRPLAGALGIAALLGFAAAGFRGFRSAPAQWEAAAEHSVQQLDNLQCTGEFQDCRATRCCKRSGQTCYEKNEYWATCMDSCAPGLHAGDTDAKPWTCRPLANRTRFESGCAWPGQECTKFGACCSRGFQCVTKTDAWAGCTPVERGPWTNNVPAAKVAIPKGWQGEVLGGWRAEYMVAPAGAGKQTAGTSLFCFMAVLPGSPEQALVEAARIRKAHIFGCEGNAIYDSSKSKFHTWDTGVSTLVNTAAFVKVWDHVKEDGQFAQHDWTVKVDADCVFFPARLRSHLQKLNPPAYTPMYVKNTMPRFTLGGFLGAIEILSKTAVETYLDNTKDCRKFIGMTSGEDGFLKDCVDALGVGYMHDDAILHPSDNPVECSATEFVAYHPMKAPGNWIYCYDLSVGNVASPPPIAQGGIDLFPKFLRDKYNKMNAATTPPPPPPPPAAPATAAPKAAALAAAAPTASKA